MCQQTQGTPLATTLTSHLYLPWGLQACLLQGLGAQRAGPRLSPPPRVPTALPWPAGRRRLHDMSVSCLLCPGTAELRGGYLGPFSLSQTGHRVVVDQ